MASASEVEKIRDELFEKIIDFSVNDPHTHLVEDRLSAPNLATVLEYSWVQQALRGAGLDENLVRRDYIKNESPLTRAKNYLPYLDDISNTVYYRWVINILIIHGFSEKKLNHNNYLEVNDLIVQHAESNEFALSVLKEAHVLKAATSYGNKAIRPENRQPWVKYMIDLHWLHWPTGATDNEPWFVDAEDKKPKPASKYLQVIEGVTRRDIGSANDLRKAVKDWIETTFNIPDIAFANVFLPIEFHYTSVPDGEINNIIFKSASRYNLQGEQLDKVIKFVTWNILEALDDWHATFQIALGADYFRDVHFIRSLAASDENYIRREHEVFERFENIKFDYILGPNLRPQFITAAKQIPNLYLSSNWWHALYPESIKATFDHVLDVMPINKFNGFFSDARYVEWAVSKLHTVKWEMVNALAKKVEKFEDSGGKEGFSKEDALIYAQKMLSANSQRLYHLD